MIKTELSSCLSTVELKGSLLSPDQQSMLLRRVRHRNDYKRWYVDWNMLDALKEVYSGRPKLLTELINSARDKNLTKQFQDVSATLENLNHFAAPDRPDARWNVNLRVAAALLCKEMKPTRLEPVAIRRGMDTSLIWSNKNASAGALGRGSKDLLSKECIETALRIKQLIKQGIPYDQIWIPSMMFHRSQLSNLVADGCYTAQPMFKDRFIWGEDGGTVTVEAQHARPLINHLVKNWYSYSGGDDPETTRSKISRAWELRTKYWVSLDFSKFDQTIPAWLITLCFDLIKKFYDKSEWAEIDWECYNFIHSKVIVPGGTVYQVDKGIPSGSNYTQIVGSMCNFLMVVSYLASLCSGSFQDKFDYVRTELSSIGNPLDGTFTLFVMGDDDLFFTRHRVDASDLSRYVERVYGVKIHPDKSVSGLSEFPHFLKRDWRGDGEYREELDMCINLIHPEYDRDYRDYSCWHILYGMFLTFRWAFPRYLNEQWFLRKMQDFGGIDALRSLKVKDLPGPFKVFRDSAREFLFNRAKRTEDVMLKAS